MYPKYGLILNTVFSSFFLFFFYFFSRLRFRIILTRQKHSGLIAIQLKEKYFFEQSLLELIIIQKQKKASFTVQ